METPRETRVLDRLFYLALTVKAIDGVIGSLAGIFLGVLPQATLTHWLFLLMRYESGREASDFIMRHLRQISYQLTGHHRFLVVLYLLAHGLSKVLLSAAVLQGRRWAYPWAIGFIGVFMVYSLYRITLTHSHLLAVLFLIDGATIYLIRREWLREDWADFHAY